MLRGSEGRAWTFALGRIAFLVAAGVLLGLFVGHVLGGLVAVLVVALAWQLVQLFRLDYWLRNRSVRDPPDAGGIWGEVITQVVRLHRRKRFHKQRLLQVFREIRRSAAAMPDGLVVLDAEGDIVWFNRTAGRLLGLRRKTDVGVRLGNLVRHPGLARYLSAGDFEQPLPVSPAGGERSLTFQVVPYGASQRLVLVRDVTRQARLESLRKDFVANASHELRSPLTVISGYLETLEQDPALDSGLRPPVEEMRRQAGRMNAIVRDLLELSRLDAAAEEASADPIDVRSLVESLCREAMWRASRLQVSVSVESHAQLLGNEPEIHSAFANLVDNAVRYTPPDGQVEVRWWVDSSGEGCFSVRDTGIGIPAEHLPRLTERFYRVDEGRSRATGGSGLGLAIVKHVLQHHGARLVIRSTPGSGSTFTCRFPPNRVLRVTPAANIEATGRADAAAP